MLGGKVTKVFGFVRPVSVYLLACLLMILAALMPHSADAAEFRLVYKKHCAILLDGPIGTGDAKKLKLILSEGITWDQAKAKKTSLNLCLNSTGGSYLEAAKMMTYLMSDYSHYGTVIDDGMKCQNACAIVFLGGSESFHETIKRPKRILHENGDLAFGLSGAIKSNVNQNTSDDLDEAFARGLEAVSELLLIKLENAFEDAIPFDLLTRVLQLQPNKLLPIKQKKDLQQLNIVLLGKNKTCKTYSENKSRTFCDKVLWPYGY